jgi:multicomponent Na+:H+ antiporter subunit E
MILPFLRSVLLLALVYLAVTGNLEPANIVLGLLIAIVVTLLVRPRSGPTDLRRLPGALWGLARYTVILIVDIIKNGLNVARIVLDPALPIRPGIIAIPSGCQNELAAALSAHAITVTPGELVIGIDDQFVLYVHCLDVTRAAEHAAQAQAMRRELLSKILS